MAATADLLKEIVQEKFEIDPGKLKPEATLEDIGIDSLDVFDLIFTAEEKLGIKVSNTDVDLNNFQDLVDLIDRVRVEQGKA